jgi:hypothetical protein
VLICPKCGSAKALKRLLGPTRRICLPETLRINQKIGILRIGARVNQTAISDG